MKAKQLAMITRYRVDSRETRIEDCAGRCGRSKSQRIDVLKLVLSDYKMPIVRGEKSVIYANPSTIAGDFSGHESSIRHISLSEECVESADTYFEGEYLTAQCPFCGSENELEHDRWFVSVNMDGEAEVSESRDPQSDCLKTFAGYPREWVSYCEGHLIPLDECEEEIERPYGQCPPIEGFGIAKNQMRLFDPDDKDGEGFRQEWGRPASYKGIYACSHCGTPFYVVYGSDLIISLRYVPREAYSEPTVPLNDLTEIEATIVSDDEEVKVRFNPHIVGECGKIESIVFDLVRGYTSVDGRQLMKENFATDVGIFAFPFGFHCEGLISHLLALLGERIGSIDHAVNRLRNSRISCHSGGSLGNAVSFVDLAVANRLRGYPDALYESILAGLDNRRNVVNRSWKWVRQFDVLPIRYENIESVYGSSGLPQVKSIRRIAFAQPLVIASVMELDQIPFSDLNILSAMLRHEKALTILDVLTMDDRGGLSVFSCLKRTHGELATWKFMEGLVDDQARLRVIGTRSQKLSLDPGVLSRASSMPIKKAAGFYQEAIMNLNWLLKPISEKYAYSQKVKQLEGDSAGFAFVLPSTPLEFIYAGADMGNCLAQYVHHSCQGVDYPIVLLVYEGGNLAGAVEMDEDCMTVIQANARYNKPIDSNSLLEKAFLSWMEDKGLKYEPYPLDE